MLSLLTRQVHRRYRGTMPKPLEINREIVKTLYLQGYTTKTICDQTGCTPTALKTWRNRFKWNQQVAEAREIAVTHSAGVQSRSLALRETLADVLAKHSAALAKVPASPNLKHIKQVGDALEPLTRSAKTVFDWGNDKPNALIVMGDMRALDQKKQFPLIEAEQPNEPPEAPLALPPS